MRRGELTRAAKEYGRAEEAIDTLNRQHYSAVDESSRAERELSRALRSGVPTVRAEDEFADGNKALDGGDYEEARMHYLEARIALATN